MRDDHISNADALTAHLLGLAFGAILILGLAGAVVESTRVLGW